MRATIEAGVLTQALAFVVKVVPVRTTIPIIAHVLLTVDGMLVATAHDLDLMHQAKIDILDGEPGTVTLSAHRLFRLVAALPADTKVTLKRACELHRPGEARGTGVERS